MILLVSIPYAVRCIITDRALFSIQGKFYLILLSFYCNSRYVLLKPYGYLVGVAKFKYGSGNQTLSSPSRLLTFQERDNSKAFTAAAREMLEEEESSKREPIG
ncbi:hypothetical protein CRENBAI_000808 [Crenichthys baileyi]|uniref:Uncharacterized protein n=1 Tax=Crenichthys baileyi TaxID=28760 RepID=A0AAV9SMM7_9TELE